MKKNKKIGTVIYDSLNPTFEAKTIVAGISK